MMTAEELVFNIAKTKAKVGWEKLKEIYEAKQNENFIHSSNNYNIKKDNEEHDAMNQIDVQDEKVKAEEMRMVLQRIDESENVYFVTGDQVVVCDGTVLEKPSNRAEAKAFIQKYPNNFCETVGCIFVVHFPSGRTCASIETTKIFFSGKMKNFIDEISVIPEILHCAGGLCVEHDLVEKHVEKIEGRIEATLGMSCDIIIFLIQQIHKHSNTYTTI